MSRPAMLPGKIMLAGCSDDLLKKLTGLLQEESHALVVIPTLEEAYATKVRVDVVIIEVIDGDDEQVWFHMVLQLAQCREEPMGSCSIEMHGMNLIGDLRYMVQLREVLVVLLGTESAVL